MWQLRADMPQYRQAAYAGVEDADRGVVGGKGKVHAEMVARMGGGGKAELRAFVRVKKRRPGEGRDP
ncbi:hypothetical protein GCM10027320_08710 [Massilia solisilvae]